MKPRLTPFRKAISRNKLYGILLVIIFGITTSLGVAALTDSQKERVADMVRIIRESAATLSGADLAEYYGAINVGLQDAIQVLTDVRDNVAQNAPISPCGTMPTVVGGIQNMPVCDTVTKQWKNQDGSPVVTAGSTTSTLSSAVLATNTSTTTTSSSPCGPMPTGIGGIQDMPTCGSDGKWRDPSGKVIGGATSNITSKITILHTSQVYDMSQKNTLTNEVNGLSKENTKVCVEVLAHPNVSSAINSGYCSDTKNFTSFSGNNEWTYNNGKWVQYAPYDPAIWGAVGIKVRAYWMDNITKEIVTSNVEVIAGTSQASSNNTSSSPCGPMPTGIGGIQDMPTCGSDGKWRDPSGKVIGGDTSTTGGIKTAQSANNTSTTSSICSGSRPTGAGVESQEVGITTGDTSWHYSSSLGACSWRCSSGYTRSGNSCIQNATSGTNQNTTTTTSSTSQGTPANEKIRITGKSCNFTGAPQTYYYKMGGTCGGALFDCNNGALEYSSTQFISGGEKPTPTTPVYDTEDLCNGITGSNVKIDVAYGRTELNCLSPDGNLAIDIWNAKEDIEICQEVDIAWRNQKNVCDSTGTEGWVKASTAWPGKYSGGAWHQYVNLLDHKAYVPGKYRFAVRSSDKKVVYSNWITVVAQASAGAEQFVNPKTCIPNRYKPASAEELIDYMANHASFWMGFIDFTGLGSNSNLVSNELFSMFELGGSAIPKMGSTIAYSYPGMHKYFTKSVPTPPSTYKDAYGTVIAGESGNTAYFDFQSWYKGGSAWTAAICSSAHPTVPLPVSQVHGGKAWKSGDKEPTKCN